MACTLRLPGLWRLLIILIFDLLQCRVVLRRHCLGEPMLFVAAEPRVSGRPDLPR